MNEKQIKLLPTAFILSASLAAAPINADVKKEYLDHSNPNALPHLHGYSDQLAYLEKLVQLNYLAMLGANIGSGARKDLIKTQKLWEAEISRCSNVECLQRLLEKRIDEICVYPVLSGVFPNCKTLDEISPDYKQD